MASLTPCCERVSPAGSHHANVPEPPGWRMDDHHQCVVCWGNGSDISMHLALGGECELKDCEGPPHTLVLGPGAGLAPTSVTMVDR